MGTYRILKKLAAGGMAEVFLGKVVGASGFEKPVAVKRILPSYGQDPKFIGLFLREAKLAVALQHANVVQVLDLGTSHGQYYMVMEFVDGETLRALLKATRLRNINIGLRECCWIVQQVANALAYAHEQTDRSGAPLNIIHRDVNPSNVLIARNGEVKLADFGIAKAADGHQETQSGVIKGKFNYLSPEQVRGGGKTIDQRSDIFLLGLMLHELLSGKILFQGTYVQTLQKIGKFDERTLEPLPLVPPPLWAIIQKALANNPAERYAKARDLSDALQTFLFDHRLKVGANDVAALFARAFPDRHSPIESSPEERGEEIRIEPGEPANSDKQAEETADEMDVGPTAVRQAPSGIAGAPRPDANAATARTSPPAASPPPLPRRAGSPPLPAPPSAARPAETPRPASSTAGSGPKQALAETPRAATSAPAPTGPRPAAGPAEPPRQAPISPVYYRPQARRRLGDILLARGVITQSVLEDAVTRHKRSGRKLGELLVAESLVRAEDLVRALSEQSGIPFITDEKLQTMPVPDELLKLIPQELAEKLCVAPVVLRGRELYCAVLEPRDLRVHDAIKFSAGAFEIRGLFCTESAIRRAIRRFYLGKTEVEPEVPKPPEPPKAEAPPVDSPEKVMQFAEKFMGRSILDEKEFEPADPDKTPYRSLMASLAPADAAVPYAREGSGAPSRTPSPVADAPEPAAQGLARPVEPVAALRARTVLVVADRPEQREAAVRVLSQQGITAAGVAGAQAEQSLAGGSFDLALVAEDAVEDPASLAARLKAAASASLEVRQVPSLGAALAGEGGPFQRLGMQYARVLEVACGLLEGVASFGPSLAKLARRVLKRMGASVLEQERASVVAYAIAVAAQLEGRQRFELPSPTALLGLVGGEVPELAELVPSMKDGPSSGSSGRVVAVLQCAIAFLVETQSATPSAASVSRALTALTADSKLPMEAIEALAAEVAGNSPQAAASSAPRIIVADPDTDGAVAVQLRLIAEGWEVVRVGTGMSVMQAVGEGADACILGAGPQDMVGLISGLRADARTERLPLFVFTPAHDAAAMNAVLEAGADDVLVQPVNVDILVAKLRRALGPKAGAKKAAPAG